MHAEKILCKTRAALEAQAPLSKEERDMLMEGVGDTPDAAQLHAMILQMRDDLNELNDIQAKDAEVMRNMSASLQNSSAGLEAASRRIKMLEHEVHRIKEAD